MKYFITIFVYITGGAMLIGQIWKTFQTFIEKRSTFSVTTETFDRMILPTILFYPMNQWDNGYFTEANVTDKEWFFKQFIRLNDALHFTILINKYDNKVRHFWKTIINLTLGDNWDEHGNHIGTVEEFLSPNYGLYYALTPSQNNSLSINDDFDLIVTFEKGVKIPDVEIILTNPGDRYIFLQSSSVGKKPFKINPKTGTVYSVGLRKLKWNYLQSKRNCKHYSDKNSYMKCVIEKQVECYKLSHNTANRACKCVPENTFKSHFEMFPLSWNMCTTNHEYKLCYNKMYDCYYDEMVKDMCPLPCTEEVYIGHKWKMSGFKGVIKSNQICLAVRYSSMDIDVNDEVLIQEPYDFIGTVGGSLGLFIGFSYTGFMQVAFETFLKANRWLVHSRRTNIL